MHAAAAPAPATVIRRVVGFAIDVGLWVVALFCAFVAGVPATGARATGGPEDLFLGIAALIFFTQLALFFRAKTIGKALLGLEVRYDRSGEPADALRMIVREMLSRTVSLVFAAGYAWALFDPERRTLHDRLTNTIVVRRLKQPRAAQTTAAPEPAGGTPILVAPPARPSFSLDGLFTLVPRGYVAGALVVAAAIFVGAKMRANAPPPDQSMILSRALEELSENDVVTREALELDPTDAQARILWVRYAASIDVRAVIDSALAAHGIPDGFGPPDMWLTERYLGRASDHPAIGEHWPRYIRFHDSFATRLPELTRAAVTRRAAHASLASEDRSTLLAYLETEVRAREDVWRRRRALAEQGALLHQKLIDADPPLTPARAIALRETTRARVALDDLRHWERLLNSSTRSVLALQQ